MIWPANQLKGVEALETMVIQVSNCTVEISDSFVVNKLILLSPHYSPAVPQMPAAVPPRPAAAGGGRGRSQTIARNMDSRQLLIGMGFPKNRA